MGSLENQNLLLDYLIDEIPVSGADFGSNTNTGFFWQPQGFDGASSGQSVSLDANGLVDVNGHAESGSGKRARPESCGPSGSKACREKMRRDRLNDKFLELGSILEIGKPPKMDKAAILSDATRMVTQLRSEAEKLKDSNESLQEKIKELKAEKNELRDEKQRLRAEKEGLEHQLKAMTMPPTFVPYPPLMPNPFMATAQTAGGKMMMPFMSYPGFMPQFQLPTNADDKDELPPAA